MDIRLAITGAQIITATDPTPVSVGTILIGVDGRRIVTMVDRAMEKGPHRLTWSPESSTGRTLAAGVYFIRGRLSDVDRTLPVRGRFVRVE